MGGVEEVAGQTDAQSSSLGIVFHPASAIDETAVAQVQTDFRRPILRAFVGRGLLESCDAKQMLAYQHSGFSVDAGVCIEADDRAALEAAAALLRPPTFCHGSIAQRGGIPHGKFVLTQMLKRQRNALSFLSYEGSQKPYGYCD